VDQTCNDWVLFEDTTSCSHRHHVGTVGQLNLTFFVKIYLKQVGLSIALWCSLIVHWNVTLWCSLIVHWNVTLWCSLIVHWNVTLWCSLIVHWNVTLWCSLIVHWNEHRINWIGGNVRDRVAGKQNF